MSCGRCFTSVDLSSSLPAKQHKTVMFENADKLNADISKDKRTVYRLVGMHMLGQIILCLIIELSG